MSWKLLEVKSVYQKKWRIEHLRKITNILDCILKEKNFSNSSKDLLFNIVQRSPPYQPGKKK